MESGEIIALMNIHDGLGKNGNGFWRVRLLQGDMNSTSDKSMMTFSEDAPSGFWPIYKGASLDLWDSDRGPKSYYAWGDPVAVKESLFHKRLNASTNKASPFSEFDSAWTQSRNTLPCLSPRITYRKISRATDSRTVRAALVPANVFLATASPFILWPNGDESDQAFLLGCICSLVFDWYARRFVESNVDFFLLTAFPIPRPNRDDSLWQRVVSLSGRLASPDERFADWAKTVGGKHGPVEADEKEDMIHELDAAVAHLYGLSESQLRHIFETFHVGWDYEDRLASTIDHYHRLESKI